jgi:hypothetical protein
MLDITRAYKDAHGIYRWKSNDRVPFDNMLQSWGVTGLDLFLHQVERAADTERFLAEYRVAQSERTAEQLAEEAFEMRAAFGPGQTIVNIITGEGIKT